MPDARDAAERAAAIDPDSAVAHAALGIVRLQYDWNWVEAKRELDRALEKQPGSVPIRMWLGRWFDVMGRRGEALSTLEQALALDPLSAELRVELDTVRGAGPPQPANEAEAAAFLDSAEARREEEYVDALHCVSLAVALKDWEPALDWLEWAYDERSPAVELIRLMRLLPPSPRLEALAAKMRLLQSALDTTMAKPF
jgi:tetratricopeptide (TPR) repeat protein